MNNGTFDGNRAATSLYWAWYINNIKLSTLLLQLEGTSLASQSTLSNGVQWTSNANQWQIDVTHWFATLNAEVQASYINTVLGPGLPTNSTWETGYWGPGDDLQQELCDSQVSGVIFFCSTWHHLY